MVFTSIKNDISACFVVLHVLMYKPFEVHTHIFIWLEALKRRNTKHETFFHLFVNNIRIDLLRVSIRCIISLVAYSDTYTCVYIKSSCDFLSQHTNNFKMMQKHFILHWSHSRLTCSNWFVKFGCRPCCFRVNNFVFSIYQLKCCKVDSRSWWRKAWRNPCSVSHL